MIHKICPSCSSVFKVKREADVVCCRRCGQVIYLQDAKSEKHNSKTINPVLVLRYRKPISKSQKPELRKPKKEKPISKSQKLEPRKPKEVKLISEPKKKKVSKIMGIEQSFKDAALAIKTVVDTVEADGKKAMQRIALKEAEVEKQLKALDRVIDSRIDSKLKIQEERFLDILGSLRTDITKAQRTLGVKMDGILEKIDGHLENHKKSHVVLMKEGVEKKE